MTRNVLEARTAHGQSPPGRRAQVAARVGLATLAFLLAAALSFVASAASAAREYLPLAADSRWVLTAPRAPGPISLQVVEHGPASTTLRFSTPWSSNLWRIVRQDGHLLLTGYGTGDRLAPVAEMSPFFDFRRPVGSQWSGAFGRMAVDATDVEVRTSSRVYNGCVRLLQTSPGGTFAYTFAADRGLVQFSAGPFVFVLDESASTPGNVGPPTTAPHIPATSATPIAGDARSRHPLARTSRPTWARMLVGVTTNTLANEPPTPANLMRRFEQTISSGITYISGAGLWTDFEPSPGRYDFQSLDHQVREAERARIPMSYTLRVIDTVHRRMPGDLQGRRWTDLELERRALRLVEELVPRFRGQVKWFMFGNEIDGYFQRHPDEIADFAKLFEKVRKRFKELAPDVAFSTTVMFTGVDTLGVSLAAVDAHADVVALTYYPMQPDFTVQDPGVPARDFAIIRQTARGRRAVLQEIGYPSSPLNNSSQDKQRDFYTNVFAALHANRDLVEAASFFVLADLSDKAASDLATYYGIGDAPVFKAFLQTLGMFDERGQPKANWSVFTRELAR